MFKKHWHGVVQAVTVIGLLIASRFLSYKVYEGILHICDAILFGEILLTFAIAVILSHSYNYERSSDSPNSIREKAEKMKATWLHANFCWQTINVWMTITPLYCTCATIYLSGTFKDSKIDQLHILIYSIISLVLSLGIYVIRPSNRGSGYRKAYLGIAEALANYSSAEEESVAAKEKLIAAIIEGEKNIAKQDLLDP